MLFAISMLGQDATRKTVRKFETAKPTSVSETGLVLAYNMLLSGSQVVPDISGTGNNGTGTNVDYTFKMMDFDGVSSMIQAPDNASLDFEKGDFTLNVRIKSVNDGFILAKKTSGATPNYSLDLGNSAAGKIRFLTYNGTTFGITLTTINDTYADGNWHDVYAVRSGTNAYLYVDGALENSAIGITVDSLATASPLYIARDNGVLRLGCQISEVNIYNIALTESQIVAKYNESIKLQLLETFSYSSDLASNRNWIGGTGTYEVLTTSTGENVINGSFTGSADAWTLGVAWTYNENAVDFSGATSVINQTVDVLEIGKSYLVSIDITNYTGSGNIGFQGGSAFSGTIAAGNASYSEVLIATDTDFGIFGTGTSTFTLDNISVTEVTSPTVTNGTQYFNCTSAGTIAIQSSTAYGTWEFDLLKGGETNDTDINFIMDISDPLPGSKGNGYQIRFSGTEVVQLIKRTDGGANVLMVTSTSFVNINQYYHITVTRTTDGEFTVFLDGVLVDVTGGSGTNPVTDNTFTSSNFIVLDLDVGDKFSGLKVTDGVIK